MTWYDRYLKSSLISTSVVLSSLISTNRILDFISDMNPRDSDRFGDYSGWIIITTYFFLVSSILLLLLIINKYENTSFKYVKIAVIYALVILLNFYLSLKFIIPFIIKLID